MTTLREIQAVLDDTRPGLTMHSWRFAEEVGAHRAVTHWADLEIPGWGWARVTETSSERIYVHHRNGVGRVLATADLSPHVTAHGVAGLLCGLAGHLDYP